MEENKQMKKKGMARNGFVVYALGVIDEMERGRRYGMAQAYRNSVKSLVQFTGSQRVPFQLFRFEMLKAYEGWLLQEGCCENTVHYYLRNLRAIYNKAVKEKVIRPRMNPFLRNLRYRKSSRGIVPIAVMFGQYYPTMPTTRKTINTIGVRW